MAGTAVTIPGRAGRTVGPAACPARPIPGHGVGVTPGGDSTFALHAASIKRTGTLHRGSGPSVGAHGAAPVHRAAATRHKINK